MTDETSWHMGIALGGVNYLTTFEIIT